MNFLAHSVLSFGEKHLIAGNYLGDFLKPREVELLPLSIRKGIRLHRKIDEFTDQHPKVRESISTLRSHFGKYTPVVLDIYFDYLLTRNWSAFVSDNLEQHSNMIYNALESVKPYLSGMVGKRMSDMISDNWLTKYGSYQDLKRVFHFLSRRAKFRNNLLEAEVVLTQYESKLDSVFCDFFPELYREAQIFSVDLLHSANKE